MNVKQLILKLQSFPENAIITYGAYEWGYREVESAMVVPAVKFPKADNAFEGRYRYKPDGKITIIELR